MKPKKEQYLSEPKRYIKKPIVIIARKVLKRHFIPTLEGTMVVNVGDYLITGVEGDEYPCKPQIFKNTYRYAGRGEWILKRCKK